ncbi:hypothetical protein M378DRAFT_22861 [Amanita muscaria Koide BX008]|uniref:F-box domain-containing protein n=1 Tax=Amanita muscaria (strain Koide BX008) TaxID=946122 RepID=A0A0C2TJP5_AMAMK|nr:hypothetical protein M378DRAFT_22861 [Amanita muscaria Koide BX008]
MPITHHSSQISSLQRGTARDMLISSDTVQGPIFSLEIIAEIIGYLHDDKKTLLTLGLVSKQALYESRHHLFSTVYFSGPYNGFQVWKDFDEFLWLVDVAWTSFTPTIQCISIQYADDTAILVRLGDISLARIRTNLPNVKSLRLLSLHWTSVPSYILDLVFQLHIKHLSLDGMHDCDATNLLDLFRRFPPSLRTLDFKGMRSAKIPDRPDLSKELSIFHRPFRFETLDSQSLLLFESVWHPSICHDLDIKVKSFRLQPLYNKVWLHQREDPFIFRFLQHIAPSLENLKISMACLALPYDPKTSLLDPIPVSQCINLRSLEIEKIRLEEQAPYSATIIDVVQNFLSSLPSPRTLQAISIGIEFIAMQSLKRRLTMLELFKWSSLVETVQRLFPNLNRLAIHIGGGLCWFENPTSNPYIYLLRRITKVRDLEEKGVIELYVH